MVTEPQFQLTKKEREILQAMLEQHRGQGGPFLQLLEYKLRASAVRPDDDGAPATAALGRRVAYLVDGEPAGPHLLVQEESPRLPDDALSIHTIRGLALLGLPENGSIGLDRGDGVKETLRIEAVLPPPRAAGDGGTVIRFRPRTAPAMSTHNGPEDDDPGPHAA